ncbi:hypothetical protein EDD17DRAFT_997043 [Pisolithus thermaeus]|nr:hypothetical protein EV401DRAFT_660922 [Pisolithus croceorrhizus]KAI6158493.1 hypothetical protein EDD17DRAFT_997043 [Pisolithus thermaeus]
MAVATVLPKCIGLHCLRSLQGLLIMKFVLPLCRASPSMLSGPVSSHQHASQHSSIPNCGVSRGTINHGVSGQSTPVAWEGHRQLIEFLLKCKKIIKAATVNLFPPALAHVYPTRIRMNVRF